MFKPPRRAAWLLLATAAWPQHSAYAYSVPLLYNAALLERTTSTCSSGFSPCVDTGLPSNFCCPTDAVCDPLAGNTTVVCCPLGSDCSQITPITCDIQKQNVDLFPDAPIKTTALNGNLGKCGENTCCPFGYSCSSSQDSCIRNANQNAAPLQNVPTTSATTATSTAGRTSSQTTTLSATSKTTSEARTTSTDVPLTVVPQTSFVSTAPTASKTSKTSATSAATTQSSTATNVQSTAPDNTGARSSSPSKASIAGGVVGGLAGVLLISAALWFFCRHRRRSGTPNNNMGGFGQPGTAKSSNSMSSFGNIINNPLNITISSPKPQDEKLLYRADFIRKAPPPQDQTLPPVPAADAVVTGGGSGVGADNGRAAYNISPLTASESGSGLRLSPRPLTLRRSQPPEQQQQWQPVSSIATSRESAMEMEINVGVDPRMFLDGGSFTVSPTSTSPTSLPPANTMRPVVSTPLGYDDPQSRDPRYQETMATMAPLRPRRSQDRLTTFSGLMREANLDPQRPYVPQGTPDPRSR